MLKRFSRSVLCASSLFTLLANAAVAEPPPDFLLEWGSFGTGAGQFDSPQGVAVGPGGDVWVVDSLNHRVQKFSADGAFLFEFGSLGTGDGELASPRGIAVSATGEVYVSDNAHRVQRFSPSGVFQLKIGTLGSGDGQLLSPDGVALGSAGEIYVASSAAGQIQKFDAGGNFLLRWGSIGTADGELDRPLGVAVGDSGEVFVADSRNSRVQVFDASGQFLRKWGTAGSGVGQFGNPIGIDIGPDGGVYVADQGNDRVQKFDTSGNVLSTWGQTGFAAGDFNVPRGLAVDDGGMVYVGDRGNHRVQKFGLAGPTDVQVTPGAYTGNWSIVGQTGLLSGAQVVTLEAGSYLVQIAALAAGGTFSITVTSSGLVTVDNGLSAAGGFGALDFVSEPVAVNTGAFAGRWGFSRVNFAVSGDRTVDLVPEIRYQVAVGQSGPGGTFEVHLAADGTVTSFEPAAATGGLNVLDFVTTPIFVDVQTYGGQWGVVGVNFATTGSAAVDLLPELTYSLQVGDVSLAQGGGFVFEVALGGLVTPLLSDAASGDVGQLTLLTRDVAVDVDGYSGGWGFSRVNFATNGSQAVSLVRNIRYEVRIASLNASQGGSFTVDLESNGDVIVANGVSATGGSDSLVFRTVSIGVDPGTFANTWNLVFIVQQFGLGALDLVPGVSYRLTTSVGSSDFAVSDPCAVNPSLHNIGSPTIEVFCGPPDGDQDGVPDGIDNCPQDANGDQVDQDLDGLGNACDDDLDGDGINNDNDNCPLLANADQLDQDGDGTGDDCDADADGDAVPNDTDNCPLVANTGQADSDGDQSGDSCDPDDDGDLVDDDFDNCPLIANSDQFDIDGDGAGDVCDGDTDGDGVLDASDVCPSSPTDSAVDALGCSGPQRVSFLCVRSDFALKGHYVSCVAHAAQDAVLDGLLTHKERAMLVTQAAQGD